MSGRSDIEWTEHTWNPTTGCSEVSPGCRNCYARTMARRLQAMGTPGYQKGFELTLHSDRLEQPLRRKKPTRYFVNSMSDLFHEDIPAVFIDQVFSIITLTPHHTYQILTKRSQIMRDYFKNRMVPPNVWLGVTVEDKQYSLSRIEDLREVAPVVAFLSCEPLLEDLGRLDLNGLHWVIVGGESGPGARPMQLAWVVSLRDQCLTAKVPFFFKQWGAYGPDGKRHNKKVNGRLLDGRIWNQYPA